MYNSSGSPCQLKMSTDHLKHSVSLGIGIALVRHSIPSVRGAGRQCSACESSGPNGTKWRRLPQGTHLSDVRQALGCLYGGLVGLQEGDHLCTDRLCLYMWLSRVKYRVRVAFS